ncbi:MAG: triphosphoribosyl-dephospho-CoA synthase [Aerococcus sp.]|nr:triphosphoribosyl-dephospho-CoA synthase [Aerococcus sp.]
MEGLSLLLKERALHPKTAPLRVLLYLMSVTQDTNVIHRGGIEGYNWLRARAHTLYAKNLKDEELLLALQGFNQECIERRISPGGAADLLSLTLYLERIFTHLNRPAHALVESIKK